MSRKVGIILTAIIGIIVGLWLWAGIIPKNSTQIGGSTSVDPVMQRLTNTYHKHYKGDSFIYSSSGSTGGVNNAKSGTYKIGFISRALDGSSVYVPDTFKNNADAKNTTDANYKTGKNNFSDTIYNYLTNITDAKGEDLHYVQIATDAIILTYDAPSWFTDGKDNFSDAFNIVPTDTKTFPEWQALIRNIYSGNETWSDVARTIHSINGGGNLNSIPEKDNNIITVFAREPGSGTRNSFDNEFGLGLMGSPSKATEYNSNGMMYNNFRINTFGYMSLNYLGQIQGNNNLETVRVNGINPHDNNSFNMSKVNANKSIATDYTLTRPYIGLIKWNLDKKEMRKISDFLSWISTAQKEESDGQTSSDKDDAYSQFLKAGLKPEFRLDDPTVPRAVKNLPNAIRVDKQNDNLTNWSLQKTFNDGYLPKH